MTGEGVDGQSGRAIALRQSAALAELGPFILSYRGWKLRVYRAVFAAVQRYWTGERWIRVTDNEGWRSSSRSMARTSIRQRDNRCW